jgi:hypothetical protein
MADIYRVVYPAVGGTWKSANVSATSVANAIAAVKSNDSQHKIDTSHVTAYIVAPSVITGS